ncbi:DNA polymerase-3 subunit epsilon [Mycolicibacterium sp. BK634]|nr:DNA polymerase-3 subunit epsilon [Mycolicibacterium sp. BK634]
MRWWDGKTWTGHTTGDAPGFTVNAPTSHSSKHATWEHLVGRAGRIAVIDVETTGVYNVDRIVEIAILTLDCNGNVRDEFETMVQPLRDVGATWIHGIDAGMLRDAPTFADVAQHVAARVDGAVVAGHNVRFDMRMIGNELAAAGIDIDWGLGLDTLRATRCKLEVACAEHGIEFVGAHRALVDAHATAQLLDVTRSYYDSLCTPAIARPLYVTPMRVCSREGQRVIAPPAPYLAALAHGIHSTVEIAPYIQLLTVAMADLRIANEEQYALRALAHDLGLDDRAVARAHREFLNGLIDAALEDQVVTDDEHQQLCRAAAVLDIDVENVVSRTDPYRAAVTEIWLTAGKSVCFTGQGKLDGVLISREDQEAMALQKGLVVTNSVTLKGPDLVVAADGDSRSVKARTARRAGHAICTFSDFVNALDTGCALQTSQMASTGVALVCVECGESWMAPRRVTRPRCKSCAQAILHERQPLKPPKPPATPPSLVVELVCSDCGARWERARIRGRRPTKCPECLAKESV